jgi:AcrR family transcriptional regulator
MRQSSAEIDHAILDVAAGLFATFGYRHASVQQVADAVGYSKPGLLHRFGSKGALHRAVLAEVDETVEEILGQAASHHGRPDQAAQVLELIARKALARPGMLQMVVQAFQPTAGEAGAGSARTAGLRLVEALDHPVTRPADRLRLVLALKLVADAAAVQKSSVDGELSVDPGELVPMLASLAAEVLGVRGAPSG